jgi:hypothetical protein
MYPGTAVAPTPTLPTTQASSSAVSLVPTGRTEAGGGSREDTISGAGSDDVRGSIPQVDGADPALNTHACAGECECECVAASLPLTDVDLNEKKRGRPVVDSGDQGACTKQSKTVLNVDNIEVQDINN